MEKVLIAGSSRTPIGAYDGKLKDLPDHALSVLTIKDVLKKAGLDGANVSELIVGIAKQTSSPSNCARYIGLAADIPEAIPAYTVQRQGASGLQAVVNGFTKIRAGSADVILAVGAESMSQIPYEIQDARYHFSPDKIVTEPIQAMVAGGQPADRYGRLSIADMNDAIACAHGYSTEMQADYVALSRSRAEQSKLAEELVPVTVKLKKKMETVESDECPGADRYTASAADAAAACLLLSERASEKHQIKPWAELVSVGMSAGSPNGEGMVGVGAIQAALKKAGKTAAEMDIISINEATAAQTLAAVEALRLLPEQAREKVNPFGGALANGNPWGAAGVIELHRLLYGLKTCGKSWGLVVCGAEGGQALAAIVKML